MADFGRAVCELPTDALQGVQRQVRLSVQKLEETIAFLQEELKTPSNDSSLYTDTIAENRSVIARQHEKLHIVDAELARRGDAPA